MLSPHRPKRYGSRMFPLFLVMAGGAIGAGARYLTGRAMLALAGPNWPWGTFTVNILGGLAMGLLVGWLARDAASGEHARLLLGVGVLGGFTTFSAFSLDVALMIERGAWVVAGGYVAASVICSTMALFAGLALMRNLA